MINAAPVFGKCPFSTMIYFALKKVKNAKNVGQRILSSPMKTIAFSEALVYDVESENSSIPLSSKGGIQ